jgi:hypothetical protein
LKLTGFDCTTSNHIGDRGARALAEATHMRSWSTPERLYDNGSAPHGSGHRREAGRGGGDRSISSTIIRPDTTCTEQLL